MLQCSVFDSTLCVESNNLDSTFSIVKKPRKDINVQNGEPQGLGFGQVLLRPFQVNKSIEQRNLETTGQMKQLKKKMVHQEKMSQEKESNWPSGIAHLHLVSSALYRQKRQIVFI